MGNYLKIFTIFSLTAIVLYGFLLFDIGRTRDVTDFLTCVAAENLVLESHPRQCRDREGFLYTENMSSVSPSALESVLIETPMASSSVSSPLIATGSARGDWFFEASFPVKVIGADGTELGVGFAQSQGDWMTSEFVPFIANVSFDPGENKKGFVRFSKDNPSGLPEYDAHIDVPVLFLGEE